MPILLASVFCGLAFAVGEGELVVAELHTESQRVGSGDEGEGVVVFVHSPLQIFGAAADGFGAAVVHQLKALL